MIGLSSRTRRPALDSMTGRARPTSGSPPLSRQLFMTSALNASCSGQAGASDQVR